MADLLTEAEAAARLKMGERTLRDLRKRGLIRYVALTARKIMYRPEDCSEYVASRVRMAEPEMRRPKHRSGAKRRHGNVIPFSLQVGP